MKMLKLLVYYVQNLQNTKFYSRKTKFEFVLKKISRHHVKGKYKHQSFTIQSFTIYLLSRN